MVLGSQGPGRVERRLINVTPHIRKKCGVFYCIIPYFILHFIWKGDRQTMKNARPGFTLIEMIVAIVIVGVLAGLAIHTITHHIERSRSMSAHEVLAKAHAGYQRLLIDNQQSVLVGKAWIWYYVGMDDPNVNPSALYTYTFFPAPSAPVWLNATRKNPPAIFTPPLWLAINLTSGNITKTYPY